MTTSKKAGNSGTFHICGVFKGMRSQPKLVNNQHRISGILCDPIALVEVSFSMFVSEISSFPK